MKYDHFSHKQDKISFLAEIEFSKLSQIQILAILTEIRRLTSQEESILDLKTVKIGNIVGNALQLHQTTDLQFFIKIESLWILSNFLAENDAKSALSYFKNFDLKKIISQEMLNLRSENAQMID